jgi:hypothetical protein
VVVGKPSTATASPRPARIVTVAAVGNVYNERHLADGTARHLYTADT